MPAKKKSKKVTTNKVVKKAMKKVAAKKVARKATTVTLRGNPVSVSGKLPAKGSQIPKFTLTTGDLQEIGNTEMAGKRVILNISPSIDTRTCATSTRTFNQIASRLDNTDVYYVSADLPFAQSRFCGTEGLTNIKTASSFRSDFGKAFGVTITSGVMKGLLARAVVVLNAKGKVLYTELVSEISNEPNYDAAINSLK